VRRAIERPEIEEVRESFTWDSKRFTDTIAEVTDVLQENFLACMEEAAMIEPLQGEENSYRQTVLCAVQLNDLTLTDSFTS
jgi:hypothetical protein